MNGRDRYQSEVEDATRGRQRRTKLASMSSIARDPSASSSFMYDVDVDAIKRRGARGEARRAS